MKTGLTVVAAAALLVACQMPQGGGGGAARDLATPFFDRITWGTNTTGVTPGMGLDTNERVVNLDFNHDGLSDVLAWNVSSHRQCLYRNNGAGVLQKIRDVTDGATTGVTPGFGLDQNEDVYPIDYNGDGFTDLLVRNRVVHTSAVFLADTSGNGQFNSLGKNSAAVIVPDFWFDSNEVIVPLDYKGDHRTDLLVYNVVNHNQGLYNFANQPAPDELDPAPTRVRFYQNATGSGANAGFFLGFNLDANDRVVPFDFDSDGKTDVLVYNISNHNQGLYRGVGDGSFTRIRFVAGATGTTSLVSGFWLDQNEEVVPAYLNNDGTQDLIVRNKVNHNHALYYSTAAGSLNRRIFDSDDNVTTGFWWDSNEGLLTGLFFPKTGVQKTDLFVHNMVNLNQGMYKNIIAD